MKRKKDSSQTLILAIIIITALVAAIPYAFLRNYRNEQSEKKVSIIFISKRLDAENDFWSAMVEGINMAASEYDIDVLLMGPESESEHELQNQMIEKAIAMKPDAIALVPSDYSVTVPYAKKIEAAGIKLILMDSVMEEDLGLCVVATDNFEGGRKMGEYLKKYAEENSAIGIVAQSPSSSTAIDRESGVRSGLDEYEDHIKEVVYCYSESDKAYEVTLEMLERTPEINMIVGLNEDSAVGAARAIKDAGLPQKIRLIGFDSSMEQVQLLEEGVFDAIVVQRPLNMGYLGIKAAYQTVMNETVEAKIDSGSELITKDTIYTKENEKLLFPFNQ